MLKDSKTISTFLDHSKRKLFGVGINDADYTQQIKARVDGKQKSVWICPYYKTWKAMLVRCFCNKARGAHLSYTGNSVCEEWLTFSKFKAWMETQDWEGKQLDKDFLSKDCKIYSPETCLFISQELNKLLIDKTSTNGKYSQGVSFHKRVGKFQAQVSVGMGKKPVHLGYFTDEAAAHGAWLVAKAEALILVLESIEDERVFKVLYDKVLDLYNQLGTMDYIERFKRNAHLLKPFKE